jgi:hypothetical protein
MKYVYLVPNDINVKVYIGQTIRSLEERLEGHFEDAVIGSETHFHRAIRLYGKEHFKNIRPICQGEYRQELLNLYEIYCIAFYRQLLGRDNVYNIANGGAFAGLSGENSPSKRPEVRAKLSKAKKRKPSWNKGLTKETDSRVMNISKALAGRPFSPTATKRQREAVTGRPQSVEHIKKRVESRLRSSLLRPAYCPTEKTRKHQSEIMSGRKSPHSREHHVNLGKANKGKRRTVEDRVRMSKDRAGRKHMYHPILRIGVLIKQTDVSTYLNNGYEFGRLYRNGKVGKPKCKK